MRDAAEKWLVEHDPDYLANAANWKQVQRSGTYCRPRREIPWRLADDLELLVECSERTTYVGDNSFNPRARGYVGEVGSRLCERCNGAFVPTTSWNRFCSKRCKKTAEMRRYRAKHAV